MCVICKDWQLGKLTKAEAWRNLDEMMQDLVDKEEDLGHYWEVIDKLIEEEYEPKS